MVYAYGYKQKIITNLSTINESTNNFYNYKGLNFLSKLNSKNKNIVFFFHASIGYITGGVNRVIFKGYDYNIDNTDIICVSDYLINKYQEYILNWTLSTEKYNAEYIYKELFTYIINLKKYSNIVFTGTSAGGFPSLKFACMFNCIALIANSQIYLEEYGKDTGNGFHHLKNMVENNNDKLIYVNKQIESIINKYKPKKIIIYNNKKDSTYKRDIIPFIKYIEDSNISNLFEINIFDYDGIIPNGRTQHHIYFPDNKGNLYILNEFLKKNI